MSGEGLTTLGEVATGGVDGGAIGSAALVEDAGAFVAGKEKKEDFLGALAWGKEEAACLFMRERAAVLMKDEGHELFREGDTKKHDDEDEDEAATRRVRTGKSRDMQRARTLHGKRCLLCGNGRSMRGQGGRGGPARS